MKTRGKKGAIQKRNQIHNFLEQTCKFKFSSAKKRIRKANIYVSRISPSPLPTLVHMNNFTHFSSKIVSNGIPRVRNVLYLPNLAITTIVMHHKKSLPV